MWTWLQSLSGGAATFIGSLTGSALGLVALLIGALYNARLNRKRDDRLREVDARAVAAALRAELAGISTALSLNADQMEREQSDYLGPDISHLVRIFPEMLGKLSLLDVDTIRSVVDAYAMIDQHTQSCILLGCRMDSTSIPSRRMLLVTATITKAAAGVGHHTKEEIEKTLQRLDRYLR